MRVLTAARRNWACVGTIHGLNPALRGDIASMTMTVPACASHYDGKHPRRQPAQDLAGSVSSCVEQASGCREEEQMAVYLFSQPCEPVLAPELQ